MNGIGRNLSFLLGGWDPKTVPKKSLWQPNIAAVASAIKFAKETGRFAEDWGRSVLEDESGEDTDQGGGAETWEESERGEGNQRMRRVRRSEM